MKITDSLIQSVCLTYTAEELRELIKGAVRKLEEDSEIISASTGSGASYQKLTRIKLTEQINLWSAALAHLEGQPEEELSAMIPVFFHNPL